jgi:methylglyoxal/glyoxal reductase
LEESLKKLGLEYVDLFLLHSPGLPVAYDKSGESNHDKRKIAWTALEKFYENKKTRAIGVSNFHEHHLKDILEYAKVSPQVNQIEYHIWNRRQSIVNFCNENNIIVQAWGPLAQGKLLESEEIGKIGEKYNKSIAQIAVRFCLQKGITTMPKSTNLKRVGDNADIFDFEISKEDMELLDSMDKDFDCHQIWFFKDVK